MSFGAQLQRLDRLRSVGARLPLYRLAWPVYGVWATLATGFCAGAAYTGGMLFVFAALHKGYYPHASWAECLSASGKPAGESGLWFMGFSWLVCAGIVLWRVMRGRRESSS